MQIAPQPVLTDAPTGANGVLVAGGIDRQGASLTNVTFVTVNLSGLLSASEVLPYMQVPRRSPCVAFCAGALPSRTE